MKNLLGLVLLSFCLTACSCSKKAEVQPAPAPIPTAVEVTPPKPAAILIVGSNWEMVVPSGFKVEKSASVAVEGMFVDNENKRLITFVKENFSGTSMEYVLSGAVSLTESGIMVTDTKEVDLNGIKFLSVDANKDNLYAWIWAVVKDGKGYTLSCGGYTDHSVELKDICASAANSLKLK